MLKVIVTDEFYLAKFDELKNIERSSSRKDEKGHLYMNDKFECTEEMADYLTNKTKNPHNKSFVKIIEIIPEKEKIDIKSKRKTIIKKNLQN